MKNGRPRKAKGSKYERETVQEAVKFGIPAKRFWGSNGLSGGYPEGVDTLVGFPASEWRCQDKRVRKHQVFFQKLLAYLTEAGGCDAVLTREDNGVSYVILPYSKFLTLIEKACHGKTQQTRNDAQEQRTL